MIYDFNSVIVENNADFYLGDSSNPAGTNFFLKEFVIADGSLFA
jgi:hypothetical protein